LDTQDLVRMVNQIAGFFQSYPHDEAVKETADHIKKFWEPRMRAALKEIVAKPDSGLAGIALEAARAAS
jgi:formate dehydrogenase subunit delta